MFRKNMKKGFSLVELLVVITIIAILSVVAYTAVGGQTVKAKDAKRKQDLTTIQQALEVYMAENGKYPTPSATFSLESGADISAGKIPKKYLSEIPTDPGDAHHSYIYNKSGQTYQVAATLEVDGELASYQAYVVGNSDSDLIEAGAGKQAPTAKYFVLAGGGFPDHLSTCTSSKLKTGNIAQAADGTGGTDPSTCVPYDPTN